MHYDGLVIAVFADRCEPRRHKAIVEVSWDIHTPDIHLPQPIEVVVCFTPSSEVFLSRNVLTEVGVAKDVSWIVVGRYLEPRDDAKAIAIVIVTIVLVGEAHATAKLADIVTEVEQFVSVFTVDMEVELG
jgi:hypothetical protein